MPKALFFNIPAHGHVNSSLGLVTELVQRGHEIIYFATEEYRAKIESTGAHFRAYQAEVDHETNLGNFNYLALLLLSTGEQLMPQLLEAVDQEQPDYIISDSLCVWGFQVARKRHIPVISSSGTFIFNLRMVLASTSPRQLLGQALEFPGNIRYQIQYRQTAARIREKYGMGSPSILTAMNSHGDITLVYTSKAMQPIADTLDSSFKFVGPGLIPRPYESDFPLERLQTDKPVIYISLGTIFNGDRDFYEACLQAFTGSDYTVVLSLGKKFTPESFGAIPPNFILRNHVPQLDVLQHADLFITHGGMNSVHEGISFGVPLIVIPQMLEQEIVARQVVRNQAGIMLDKKQISAVRLREKADAVLVNPTYRQNALRVRDTLQNAGGASKAADEVQAFVRQTIKPSPLMDRK